MTGTPSCDQHHQQVVERDRERQEVRRARPAAAAGAGHRGVRPRPLLCHGDQAQGHREHRGDQGGAQGGAGPVPGPSKEPERTSFIANLEAKTMKLSDFRFRQFEPVAQALVNW